LRYSTLANQVFRFSSAGFWLAGFLAILCSIAPVNAAQILHGHVPHAVAEARMSQPVPRSTRLNLAIGLPLRNADALDLLLASLADPSSPNYHQYLTSAQFTEQFGPTEDDYQALIAFVESRGLAVTGTHPNRTVLDVTGAVGDVEKAFHLNIMFYQHPVRGTFYAPDREPSLDLSATVLDIAGLDNYDAPRPMSLKTSSPDQTTPGRARPLVTGSGPSGLFTGKDFRAAYAPGVTLDGTGQAVGLLEFDGFYASDLVANFKQAGLPPITAQTILLDGFDGAPGSSNIEVILDIAMAGYMAPGASKILVYEGDYPNDILNRMANDNLAQQLSSSWGFGINATTEQIFKQFIAQGQSFYQASGDSGAYKAAVMPPSDDPNVTVVGGSSLTTSGAGGPWQSERTWSGSGGGVSTEYPIPAYQQGISMAANGGSLTMRNIPDVALIADVQIFLICNNGQRVSVGGTSAAAPLWAGFTALANQKATATGKPRVGFVNPTIYSIGKGSNYLIAFHDISLGNNSGFSATAGFDLATGWGTPAGQPLIDALIGAVSSQPATFNLSSSQPGFSISPGSSNSSIITVIPQNGFTGSVALVASGLPAGVTVSFSPVSTASKSTATFTASSSAAAGISAIAISGTSGTLRNTASINLLVITPSFDLTAAASGISLKQGASGGTLLTVDPQDSFTGDVSLAVTGLPTGVTASFSAATMTKTSTLTFVAGIAAPAGTSTVTVTGTSGALKSIVTLTLSVVAPNFSLTPGAAALSIPRSTSLSTAISVGPQNGFGGYVSLMVSGLPVGVTAVFSPATTSAASSLTFTASSSAPAATSTVTVTGTSGSLTHTATISLTVIATSPETVLVSLAGVSNVTARVSDGTTFTPLGLDGGLNGVGTAYSANLTGGQQTLGGTTLYFGSADGLDAVSGKVVPLPAGQFSTIKLLATGVNGNQTSQTFIVKYTDGTTSSFVQSLSDWFTPQSFSGESNVLTMPYRDTSNGVKDNRTFLLYGYSFNLNAAKKVSSITLPGNRNVVVLAISLVGA
jgi:hypothetical protein